MATGTTTDTVNQGGQPTQQGAVRITTDVRPAWETDGLPDWVLHTVIPLLSAGQKWPEASESKLSELAQALEGLSTGLEPYTEPAGRAVRTVVTNLQIPATANFVGRAQSLYGEQAGLAGVSRKGNAYTAQVDNFAVETQYSKLSINVAFWVTIVAIAITLYVAFFTAGSTTPLIGPYAAAARSAISRILVRLATLAGREAGAAGLARLTVLSGATGRGLIARVLASPIGRELIEEVSEEVFIDGMAQYQQIKMGTRKEWDWKKSQAAAIGAGTGAMVGMGVAGPVSRITRGVPGFGGRALSTGLSNVVGSPAGSFVANGLVYDQWSNPFTADSITGAFFGGVGRTGTTSPFNPEVYVALANPSTTLASAYDAAALADAARVGAGSGGVAGGSGGSDPTTGGTGGGSPGTAGVSVPGGGAGSPTGGTRGGAPASTGTAASRSGQATADPADHGRRTPPSASSADADGTRRGSPRTGTDTDRPVTTTPDAREEQEEQQEGQEPRATSSTPDGSAAQTTSAQTTSAQTTSAQAAPDPASAAQGTTTPDTGDTSPAAAPDARTDTTTPAASDSTAASDGTGVDTGTSDAAPRPETPPPADDTTSPPDAAPTSDAARPEIPSQATTDTAPAGDTDTTPDTGTTPDTALAQGPATPLAGRVRDAVNQVLADGYPDAVLLPDGSLIVPLAGTDVVVPATAVARVRGQLEQRAAQADDDTLRTEARALLDEELVTRVTSDDDVYAALLAAAQPAGLRAHGALQRLAPNAVKLADGSLLVSDASGDYLITAEFLGRLRSLLEASAHADRSPATLRTQALVALNGTMAFGKDTSPAPARVTSRPGTVTSRPIAHTRYVTDGRPAGPDLSLDEVHAAIDELLASDFLTQEVRGWEWSADGSTLLVRTEDHGVQHFRPDVGGVRSGNMAETDVRTGDETDPHRVRFTPGMAGDQVARVWLHEITDTLQRVAAPPAAKQGVIRRMLPGRSRPATVDECVTARLNEHAFLARKWLAAATPAEKRLLQVDLDGVARELREHGQVPPVLPWRPITSERPAHTPAVPTQTPTADELRTLIDAVTLAEAELRGQVAAHQDSAQQADLAARKAKHEAKEISRMHDQGKDARARAKRKERDGHRAKQGRHLRIAQAYSQALSRAEATRQAYETALARVKFAARATGQEATLARAGVRAGLTVAGERHAEYLAAVQEALPQAIALSSALPTGRLPHLTALTDRINDGLAERGIGRRFTPEELQHILRADFRKIVSVDGMVMRVGEGRSTAELKIKLTLSDMVEILDPAIKASEIMLGTLPQGGQSIRSTEAGSGGLSVGFNTGVLAPLLPEGSLSQAVVQTVGVAVGANAGRGWSRGPSAAEYSLEGQVEDDRGESMLFDAAATWEVHIRTSREDGWQEVATVGSGNPEDAASQRLWISHVYADQPPSSTVTIDPATRTDALPQHVPGDMSGLNELAEDVMGKLGEKHTDIGDITRDNIHTIITKELPGRLGEAVNDPHGMIRVITDPHGRPIATVTINSRPVWQLATPVGQPSRDQWQELLRVGFSTASGSESFGGSFGGSLSANPTVPGLVDVNGPGDYDPTLGPGANGSRSVSRSESAFANGQAIHPGVQRYTGHTQGYRMVFQHEVSVHLVGDARPRPTVRGESTALLRIPETDAYRYGLPVDSAALLRDAKGRPLLDANGDEVLRDDPVRTPPPGRLGKIPSFLGDGPGQMKGVGPGQVQRLTGEDKLTKDLLTELGDLGVVPKFDADGIPIYSGNPLERAAQMINLREVLEQLAAARLETGYDQAAQDGILFSLVRYGWNAAPETYTVRIRLKQDFDNATFVGRTDAQAVVNLDIGSDTAGRSSGRSWNAGGGVSLGSKEGPAEGEDGLTGNVGVSGGGSHNRSIGSSAAVTVNRVTLVESNGEVALFDVGHKLTAEIIHRGETVSKLEADGSARLGFAADLLPLAKAPAPHPVGTPSEEILSRATLLHMDTTGMLDAATRVLPRGMRADSAAYHHLAAFTNVRSLIAHPEWRSTPYRSGASVRPQGALPTQAALSITGAFGEAELLGAVDLVVGDINLTLGSAGISWGGSWGHSAGTSGSLSDSDGGATSSDGGGANHSRSAGRSGSHSELDIWGRERLTIETGKQYIFRSQVSFALTGQEGHANPSELGGSLPGTSSTTQHDGRTVIYSIPEYDALTLYTDGKLDLPLHQVADAVERFRNGSMTLDRTLATSLLQKYLLELGKARSAGQDTGFADRHTPEALIEALGKVSDLAQTVADSQGKNAEQWLKNALSRSADLVRTLSRVQVAPHYAQTMGMSLVESFSVKDSTGKPVSMLDAGRAAVNEVAPRALAASPIMSSSLRGDLALDRVEGHLDAMLSERGFVKSYETLADPNTGRAELVTVRARLVPKNPDAADEATLLGHTSDAGVIQQDYGYREVANSRSYNGSHGFGAENGHSGTDNGGTRGTGTDRGRSFSASSTEQHTKMQRTAQFNGLDRIQQEFTLVVEVERTPVRRGPVRSRVRAGVDRVKGRPASRAEFRYDATLARRLPTGMTRPVDDRQPEPAPVIDPRRVEVPPAHYVNSVQAASDPRTGRSLFEVIQRQLASMLGDAVSREQSARLDARLLPVPMAAAFARMAGPGGHELVRVVRKGFRHQGVDVRVETRLSDLQVVAGPFDAEIGEVDRVMNVAGTSVSRGRLLPVSGSTGGSQAQTGTNVGVSRGEQASEGVSNSSGVRKEASKFEKGKAVTVRVRVDYDLTFQHKARLPDGSEKPVKNPVRMPGAASGFAYVTVFEADLAEMNARLEAGLGVGTDWGFDDGTQPTFRHVPAQDRQGLIDQLTDARVAARERHAVVRVAVREGGVTHRYLAAPDGSLHSEMPDGGFAQAIATLPPRPLAAAARHGLDLRSIFMTSAVPGTFTDQVAAALDSRLTDAVAALPPGVRAAAARRDLDLRLIFMTSAVPGTFTDQVAAALNDSAPPVDPDKPIWPVTGETGTAPQGGGTVRGGSVAQGGVSAPSPALPGTPFDTQARPAGQSDLSVSEVVGQDISVADLGGAVTSLGWTTGQGTEITPGVPLDVAMLAVGIPARGAVAEGVQYARVAVGEPGDGLIGRTDVRAGTFEEPHLIWIAPRTDPAVVSAVLVHEISHVAQEHAATVAGTPQGVVRTSLSEQAESTDHCLTPRLNEHAHLARKWRAATEADQRLRLAEAIDAVAADIDRRGHTPPAPPWGSGPRAAPTVPRQSRIAELINGGARPAAGAASVDGSWSRLNDYLERTRPISNGTSWYPPEEEKPECLCPQDGPCECGLRRNASVAEA
ncbi:cell envelope integrity protein TolA [Streptosporangium amethystogenes]|uniref:cell envelope integrity protein TolA n=1 Tax=Streptosporangium amethystogenes TaxID=2002 RepID=UPI0004C87087|nr:cell envelope integrity protein TolA [Streptosporangium amethystogenes]